MHCLKCRLAILSIAMAGVVACVASVSALADTFGLLPPTTPELELRLFKAPEGAPAVMAFRSRDEFKAFLKSQPADLSSIAALDFDSFMVVGITRKPGENLAIYRVELDDATKPKALLIRVAADDASTTMHPFETQLLLVPISALPIRFIRDEKVDGRVAGDYSDGVESKVLGSIDAVAAASQKAGPAAYREQAEQLARAALSDAEVKSAKEKISPLCGVRYPQPYSRIDVHLIQGVWKIRYDDFQCEVDAAGKVKRTPK